MKIYFYILTALIGLPAWLTRAENLTQNSPAYSAATKNFFTDIKMNTERGLDSMRDRQSGLIADRVVWKGTPPLPVNEGPVASTNAALDIVLLLNRNNSESQLLVSRAVDSLSKLEKFKVKGSEFFYWGYEKGKNGRYKVMNPEVSSVDNFHLAFAFYLVKKLSNDPATRQKAADMLSKMNLDPFVNPQTGLIHQAFQKRPGGSHKLSSIPYGYWGAETRSMYSLGSALNLIKSHPDVKAYGQQLSRSMQFECAQLDSAGPIVRAWDGGTFQYFLPELLFGESSYSLTMSESMKNYGKLIKAEKIKRKIPFGPALSACRYSEKSDPSFNRKGKSDYAGTAGLISLMPPPNQPWPGPGADSREDVFTPHAMMLTATTDPETFRKDLEVMQTTVGKNGPLYRPHFGYMDAYHVAGPFRSLVVPVQLSLDQAMIAMSAEKILDASQKTLSAKVVSEDPEVSRKLNTFYASVANKLTTACDATTEENESPKNGPEKHATDNGEALDGKHKAPLRK